MANFKYVNEEFLVNIDKLLLNVDEIVYLKERGQSVTILFKNNNDITLQNCTIQDVIKLISDPKHL